MTIYLPDDLGAEVKAALGDTNISAVCQAALRAELDRVKARALLTSEGFERIEFWDGDSGEHQAFRGREIGRSVERDFVAYLTARAGIAVIDGDQDRMRHYPDYGLFADQDYPGDLKQEVAEALGEKYVRELDI